MEKPTFALVSWTLGSLRKLRRQPSLGSPTVQLPSSLPWPQADSGQFLLIHYPLVFTASLRATVSRTLPSCSISRLSPCPHVSGY